MNPETTRRKIEFPLCSGWPGWAAFAFVVAARAFQPNARPMDEWSWWSWLLMSLPALYPLWLSVLMGLAWLSALAASAALESLFRRR